MYVTALKLSHFRNLGALALKVPSGAPVVALVGPNGVGKTSVLEAVSMLSPTRGLMGADARTQIQSGKKQAGIWAVVESAGNTHEIGQTLARGERTLQIDGRKSPLEKLAAHVPVVWLTPATDFLFSGPPATRRRWLDDAVSAFIPPHAEAVARYRQHRQARLKLLAQGRGGDWLDAEEQFAAETGIRLLRNRLSYLESLTPSLKGLTLRLSGNALEVMEAQNPVAALKGKFERSREIDARLERTSAGPNTLDVAGALTLENGSQVPMALASSGQHKRGLLLWLVAHAKLAKTHLDAAPVVLIDEFSAHLDAARRHALLATLRTLGCQVWLTDTETPPLEDAHVITLPAQAEAA